MNRDGSSDAAKTPLDGWRASRVSKKIERSCIVCHRRKVRCDKRSPCANCTRTGILCVYPSKSDGKAVRHPKATIADIASRLVQLERTIVAVSGDIGAKDSLEKSETSAKTDSPEDDEMLVDDGQPGAADEMLVHNGYSTRYVNEILLSRVLEEVCTLLRRGGIEADLLTISLVGARNTVCACHS